MNSLFRIPALLLLAGLIASCSGGASTDPEPVVQTSIPTATKGTIGIVLTDASVDDYDHAWVTITSVELLGEGGHQLIFSGEETVDLLALRDSLTLFAVSEDIDPDTFSKIRLHAQDMQLVVDNSDGSSTMTPVNLVANGKIDLNPRRNFSIAAGEVVFVSLDWDMNESLKLTETGNGNGKIIMRPVIFVEIGSEPAFKQGLVRIFGEVDGIAADSSVFRLCSPETTTQLPTTPVLGTLCLDVVLNDRTGLFNALGEPITAVNLMPGDPVTVLGLLRRSANGMTTTPLQGSGGSQTPATFQVTAIVVEGGAKGTWAHVRGTLNTVVEMNAFDFLVDNGQGYDDGTVVTGQLFDSSRIFSVARDTGIIEITAVDLTIDDRAIVDAVKVPAASETDPDSLNIALMLTKTPGESIPDHLKGEILSIDAMGGTMMVAAASGDVCVTTDAETRIFQLFVTGDSVESVPATLGELTAGSKVGMSGTMSDCFEADLIIAEGQASAGP